MYLQLQQDLELFFLAIFSIARPGDEIIVADPVYSPTRLLTEDYLKEFNIKTIFYNPSDLKTLEKKYNKKNKTYIC